MDCVYRDGFSKVGDVSILIDQENSVVDVAALLASSGESLIARARQAGPTAYLRRITKRHDNLAARRSAERMSSDLASLTGHPRLLVIGSGTVGVGTELFYQVSAKEQLQIVGTDIYASPTVDIIADAHSLPFRDASFDGVWIQAVLEHVIEPTMVVAEIHRVLRRDGLVYAETPFMQQVHEEAYDFSRFTLGGHRWLFKAFSEIDSGITAGPARALAWSTKYFILAMFRSETLAMLAGRIAGSLGFLDAVMSRRLSLYGPAGIYFYGRASDVNISPRDVIRYWSELKARQYRRANGG